MTRKVVAFEGKETTDGRMILNGALKTKDLTIPVMKYKDLGSDIIGKAVDLKRDEETGEVSFDIITKVELDEGLNFYVFITNVIGHRNNDDVLIVESGVIRGINVTQTPSIWVKEK